MTRVKDRGPFDDTPILRRVARAFATACQGTDIDCFGRALDDVQTYYAWREAFLAVGNVSSSSVIREVFMLHYQSGGDSFRNHVADDRVLLKGLRALLPQYNGPGLVIYRGAHKSERRYRRFGLAWTTDIVVARSHAQKDYHMGEGQIFLADAPPAAILSALSTLSSWNESEVVVDRRLIKNVAVVSDG